MNRAEDIANLIKNPSLLSRAIRVANFRISRQTLVTGENKTPVFSITARNNGGPTTYADEFNIAGCLEFVRDLGYPMQISYQGKSATITPLPLNKDN